ncbi:MAG: hypothetical protein M3482_02185 [Actinomycetota bacterium]|nr:hypothetical protein [Actinomycetota bacterium]
MSEPLPRNREPLPRPAPPRRGIASALFGCAALTLALAACGSQADTRPAAAPAPSPPPVERAALPGEVAPATAPAPAPVRRVTLQSGRLVAELDPRARELTLRDATGEVIATEPAGAGPAQLATDGEGIVWVTDAQLDALLVFQVEPELTLTRRMALPGAPWALVHDAPRERLWITLTARNEVADVLATDRPGVIGTYDTLRAPRAIHVDRAGRVTVRADRLAHTVDPEDIELGPPPPPDLD